MYIKSNLMSSDVNESFKSKNSYEFLNRSIKVIIIDKDQKSIEMYNSYFKEYELYDLDFAHTNKEAEEKLQNEKRYHICISELNINDINNDEFYIVKKYGNKIPVVLMTNENCVQKGFEAHRNGVKTIIRKCNTEFDRHKFIASLNTLFLHSIITPNDAQCSNPLVKFCVEKLTSDNPQTISEWAAMSGIAETYLRRIWNDCYNIQPKYVLFVHEIYSLAMKFYSDRITGGRDIVKRAITSKQISYYKVNRSIIDMIIIR